nr:transducin beta-like protein 2 [Ciona intestinalis]|eukprot:XP_002121074.1 transducin beta-like protein 2 [Ciona intestinalis]
MDSVTEPKQQSLPAIAVTVIAGLLIWVLLSFFRKKEVKDKDEQINETKPNENTSNVKTGNKKAKHQRFLKKPSFVNFTHPYLHVTLKGHSGKVLGLDASINGKYMASCSDDRSVRLWSVKDFGSGNKCVRVNVEFDHARQARFSPDSRAFIAGLAVENTVRVFKLGKKDDGVTTCIPIEEDFKKYNQAELLNIGVGATSSGGSYVMTAYKNTTIMVRNLKGDILHTINTNQGNNNHAAVSPCGRFVASSGWTPDVKVWAVNFTRSGDYKDVTRAFELKGHTTSVWSFDFNNDSTRMVTVSKDGSWRFYDTRVEYEKGQEPYLLNSGEFCITGCSVDVDYCIVALSPDARVAAVACMNNITVFSTATGEVEVEFTEVHSEIISSLIFDIAGRYILSSGDKHIRIFHNTLGYKETIRELEDKIKPLPSASTTRERYQKQINEAKKALAAIDKSS